MNQVSAEKRTLIDAATASGFTVTAKQIDRWRAERLLPSPPTAGSGRARGVQRPAPEGSAAQLVRLCEFLREDRSLNRAAFRLWIEDYAIPLERLRNALIRLAPNPNVVANATSEQIRDKAEQYAETIRRNKSAKPHVKKMAADGQLAGVLESFLALGLGRDVAAEEQQTMGPTFERLAGLDRARFDHWEGQSPWLTGDTSSQMALTASLLKTINSELPATATEAELLKAKAAFKSMLVLRRCAALLQQLHGPNVFGFGVLTDLPIGLPMALADPSAFLGMVALTRQQPELLDQMIALGDTLQASLTLLRQQVAQRSETLNN